MSILSHLPKYDIEDSNIALLGSDLEKRVREHAGDTETAWEGAGTEPGLQIWRIEQFQVVPWPKERTGNFYDGDSYIILNTYKKTPESESLSYDLHFWLGRDTSQDEAGTAAYKTVELDDHLHGSAVQYREVQGDESDRFLSYFPRFLSLKGGAASGFHHVTDPPALDLHNLYRITFYQAGVRSNLIVRQVPAEPASLIEGDVYVLDKGVKVWQYNTKSSLGKEKFKAAEFVHSIVEARGGQCDVTVYDEGVSGAGVFLAEFGEGTELQPQNTENTPGSLTLYRLSDATGQVSFEVVEPVGHSTLSSNDAFLLDHSGDPKHPAIYVWLGKNASLNERRLAPQYAQRYLHDKKTKGGSTRVSIPILKMQEGNESETFLTLMNA
ncbi:fragmin60 [Dendrothele bispora CBS 962.96]|uniref:Fragmin60 n=1 Tax=Dendrothele bispora (strain CBS 962.96) TaxID=1314807 RepID=A0A4S8MJM5_DENBC|nr:fragmin60 [Dendrothele bispora CBS 962.96]